MHRLAVVLASLTLASATMERVIPYADRAAELERVDACVANDLRMLAVQIGLPLAKELVEAHDGRLEIESQRGVGTKINIYLPKERVIIP